MNRTASHDIRNLQSAVRDAADAIGESAVATLAAHPDAVRVALAVAANALSANGLREQRLPDSAPATFGGPESRPLDPEDAERRASKRTRPGPPEETLNSDQFAARVGLRGRQSVLDWMRKGRVVGWRGARRGYLFPARQIDARGRPLDGIDRVMPLFGDSWAAWLWLTTPAPALDGEAPLVLLERGEIDSVVAAAEGYAQGDFS